MKCVQLKDGQIIRVSEDMAASAVAKGNGVYVSKAQWREFIRNGGLKQALAAIE